VPRIVADAARAPAPVLASGAGAIRRAAGLPDDDRGRAMGQVLHELGYRQVESWHLDRASLRLGPNERGVPIPVLRNPDTEGVVILHETPDAQKAWREMTRSAPIYFAGRFDWSTRLSPRGLPEGCMILKTGAEPYHLAEEHFHHQFSRAGLLRMAGRSYLSLDELPRAGDSEAYAATLAHRFLGTSAALRRWQWNGQADIAALFAGESDHDVLARCLKKRVDLGPIGSPSSSTGDGRPTRPGRPLGRLALPEMETTGVARYSSSTQLSWDQVSGGNVPWSAADRAATGFTAAELRGV
jgi:hypothetical protein